MVETRLIVSALVALADQRHLPPVIVDLFTAGAQKFSLAGAHCHGGADHVLGGWTDQPR
jgi:hypothetical protein